MGEERKAQIKSSAGDGAAIIKSNKVERVLEPEKKERTAGEKSDGPIVSAIDRFLGNCCTRAQNVMETKQKLAQTHPELQTAMQTPLLPPPPPPPSQTDV